MTKNARRRFIFLGDYVVNAPVDLVKIIRTGVLSDVIAALNAGAPVELNDGRGDPGLPLAIACFMGHAEIARELILRGAKVNLADNLSPISPLSMALRGKRKEVIKVLIELGAELPPGVETGLNDQELMLAKWKAQHFGVTQSVVKKSEIEEIHVLGGVNGTDTGILDAEMRRALKAMKPKPQP